MGEIKLKVNSDPPSLKLWRTRKLKKGKGDLSESLIMKNMKGQMAGWGDLRKHSLRLKKNCTANRIGKIEYENMSNNC